MRARASARAFVSGVVMNAGWQSLFVAGLLIGISVGLFTAHFAIWVAIGAALGIAMAAGQRSQRRALSAKRSVETVRQD